MDKASGTSRKLQMLGDDENTAGIKMGKSRGREREKLVCPSRRRHGGGEDPTP